MRYVWASIVAVAVISAGFLFVRQTRAYAEKKLGEQHPLLADAASNHRDVGLEVSGSEMARINAADFLISFRYVFIVLVILSCFGTAAVFGRRQPKPLAKQPHHRSSNHVGSISSPHGTGY